MRALPFQRVFLQVRARDRERELRAQGADCPGELAGDAIRAFHDHQTAANATDEDAGQEHPAGQELGAWPRRSCGLGTASERVRSRPGAVRGAIRGAAIRRGQQPLVSDAMSRYSDLFRI